MKYSILLLLLLFVCNAHVFAQGELDTTFGSGKYISPVGPGGAIRDTVTQQDNKIIVVGSCRTIDMISYPVCMFRVNNNATDDQSFGNGIGAPPGHVRTLITGGSQTQQMGSPSIVIQNDGKIMVLAYAVVASQLKSYLIRYNTNGTIDTQFGNQGFNELTAFTGFFTNKMRLQPDGKMVVLGQRFVARYMPDGTIDESFGVNGVFTIFTNNFLADGTSLALRSDGKLVVGGMSANVAFVGRINADGTLDTGFGDNGYRLINGNTGIRSLSISADNKIATLGMENIVYKLTANGSLDTSFNNVGSRQVFGTSNIFGAYDLVVSPSGKITVVGNRIPVTGGFIINYNVARFTKTGSLDVTFSGDGLFEIDINGQDSPQSVNLDHKGKAIIGGFSTTGTISLPFENPIFSMARLAAPIAQNVTVSGRVINADGSAVVYAYLTLKKDAKIIAQIRTNPFGYFRFNNISAPDTYTISSGTKGVTFNEQSILVDDAISNLQIVSQ